MNKFDHNILKLLKFKFHRLLKYKRLEKKSQYLVISFLAIIFWLLEEIIFSKNKKKKKKENSKEKVNIQENNSNNFRSF